MTSGALPSKLHLRRWWIISGLVVAAGLGLLMWRLSALGVSVNISPQDPAAAWLARLEQAIDLPVRARFPVEFAGPDGPMPRMASRELRIAAADAAVRSSIVRACDRIGLGPAGADLRALDPGALCEGREGAVAISVHLKLRCERECIVLLETRVN